MYDAIIIGAGASGLFAAVLLSGAGKKVLVLEQETRAGKKLALCGGGSCNLGPVERESGSLAARYTRYTVHQKTGQLRQEPVRQLKTLFFEYPPSLTEALWTSDSVVAGPFRGLGIRLREEEGRLYPKDFDARTLAAELARRAEHSGAEFRFGAKVTAIRKTASGEFETVSGPGTSDRGKTVILASGGFAYPNIGGNDSGNGFLGNLGIGFNAGTPAMGPLQIKNNFFGPSTGTVIPASVIVRTKNERREITGNGPDQLLFTHRGISGPLILDICAAVHESGILPGNAENQQSAEPDGSAVEIVLDLLPDHERPELLEKMQTLIREHPRKQAVQLLSDYFPRALSAILLEKSGIEAETVSAGIPKAALLRTIELVKACVLEPVLPTARFEAMSWTGGCQNPEIDFRTMEVTKQPGLFVTGDMVSFCRPCGGYSLWFCWTSALAAAMEIYSR